MDSALIGVVVGSLVSLLGSVLSQYFLVKKEERQWKNQQEAAEASWNREEGKKEKDYLREVYQNSLKSLSVFLSKEDFLGEAGALRRTQLIDEVHKWTALLLVRHPSLHRSLSNFASDPDEYSADALREQVVRLLTAEQRLFIEAPAQVITPSKEPSLPPGVRQVKFRIHDEFRRSCFIDGVELPQEVEVQVEIKALTSSQREKLLKIYFSSFKVIPSNLTLYVPVFNINEPPRVLRRLFSLRG